MQVMQGQSIDPEGYNSIVDVIDGQDIENHFAEITQSIKQLVADMPSHSQFVREQSGTGPSAA